LLRDERIEILDVWAYCILHIIVSRLRSIGLFVAQMPIDDVVVCILIIRGTL
jgi:hypothetical protein